MKKEKLSLEEVVEKKFGKGSFSTLGQLKLDIERISSGSIEIDKAIGGGYPKGRITNIRGDFSCGKTTLAIHAIVETQKLGGKVAYIDAEHAFDPAYASAVGVNINELIFFQPETGEEGLNYASMLLDSNQIDLIIIDSVAALTPTAEIEGEIGDNRIGLQARMMSQALRVLSGKIAKSKTVVITLNQIRTKIGVIFGDPTVEAAGNALKFYASIIIDITRSTTNENSIKSGEEKISNLHKIHVIKNKTFAPFKKAEFYIKYGVGIDKVKELFDLATKRGIISTRGSITTWGEKKFEDFYGLLSEDVDTFNQLKEICQ